MLQGTDGASVPAGLTGRELTVLGLLRDGRTAHAIAHRLGISPRTVHTHLANLYRKLGVNDRLQAVLVAQELGVPNTMSEAPDRPVGFAYLPPLAVTSDMDAEAYVVAAAAG